MPTKPRSQHATRSMKLTPEAMVALHRARLRMEAEYDRRVPNSEAIRLLAEHYLGTTEEPEPITRKPEEPKENWIEESKLHPAVSAIRQDFCAVCTGQIWQQRSGRWFHAMPGQLHEATPPVAPEAEKE